MLILITDGVTESDLGMVTVFCHPKQGRMEAYDALSAQNHCDSCKSSVVLVWKYSNTSYIPRGMSHSLYLDMGTLSRVVVSTQFPLDKLHLNWLLPFSKTVVLLPIEVGGEGLKMGPHLPEFLWGSSEEDCHLSDPIILSIPLPAPALLLEMCSQTEGGIDIHPACIQAEGGLGCHPASSQTEGLGYHPSLKFLQEANQDRAQLECKLIQDIHDLVEKCEHK